MLFLSFIVLIGHVYTQVWNSVSQLNRIGLQNTGRFIIDRTGHKIAPHPSGTGFYVFGGFLNGEVDGVNYEDPQYWIFNISTLLWNVVSREADLMPRTRSEHVFITHSDGQIAFLHGGQDYLYTFNDIWILNLANGEWEFVVEDIQDPPELIISPCEVNDTTIIYKVTPWTGDPATLDFDQRSAPPANISYWWEVYDSIEIEPDIYVYLKNKTSDPDSPNKDDYDYLLEYTEEIVVTSQYNCTDLDWAASPWPALKSHAGCHDPSTDTFIIHGGKDRNETIQEVLYQFSVVYFPENETWVGTYEILANTTQAIYAHSMAAVTFDNDLSLIVTFGGVVEQFDVETGLDELIDTRRIYVWDLKNPEWQGPYFPRAGPPFTSGHSMDWNSYYRQLWFTGGTGGPKRMSILDVNTRNATTWAWRTAPDTRFPVYDHDTCVLKDSGNRRWLYKFGGSATVDQSIGQIERTLFWPLPGNYTRPGTLSFNPPPPPPPLSTVAIETVVGNVSTVILEVVQPMTSSSMPLSRSSSSSSTTTTTTRVANAIEKLTGLTPSGQVILFACVGVVVFLFIMACVVVAVKKNSKKKRPAKTNFYTSRMRSTSNGSRKAAVDKDILPQIDTENVHLQYLHGQIHFRVVKIVDGGEMTLEDVKLLKQVQSRAISSIQEEYKGAIENTIELVNVPRTLLASHKPYGEREDEWYQSLVEWLLVNHRLGNDLMNARDTRIALESILPPSELYSHFKQSLDRQESKLKQVLSLTRGIRILQFYHAHKALPIKLAADVKADLQNIVEQILQAVKKSSLLDNAVVYPLFRELSSKYVQQEYIYMKDLLQTMMRNIEKYSQQKPGVGHEDVVGGVECQTDTHPPQADANAHYEYSEWKMRADALKETKLSLGRHENNQTDVTLFKRTVETQCWVHGKEGSAQTRTESGVNTTRRVRAMNGQVLTIEL